MGLQRGIDGSDPVRLEPHGERVHVRKERRVAPARIGGGTLACPRCDAPVAVTGVIAPADALGCPYCAHTGAVRDFLSLATPSRPARVHVRAVFR